MSSKKLSDRDRDLIVDRIHQETGLDTVKLAKCVTPIKFLPDSWIIEIAIQLGLARKVYPPPLPKRS